MDQALAEDVDYLLHGHTHELRDERVGATRIINPGALHRAPRYTAAILDPKADDLTIIEIPKMEPQA
jgi:predicted phosphodiesterase